MILQGAEVWVLLSDVLPTCLRSMGLQGVCGGEHTVGVLV